MIKLLKTKIKKNSEIFILIILIFLTAFFISYFNYSKNKSYETYINFIDNIYFKKTLNHIVNNLEPKYKKVKHKISSGETFDKILESYSIEKSEIIKIKNSLKKKVNLNKLNTKQIILFSLDKTNNKIDEFTYQVSNTQKIYLKRNIKEDYFSEEIVSIKLDKKIIYKEDLIVQSLYKTAVDQKIPANTIIEFARIYGFQVDFQRDIRKNDWFEIMYEKFEDENKRVRETGKILYASMFVNGEEINLYNFKFKNEEDYFNIKGKSITKSFMKTPINGARLSSSFGMRKHPILGYNKMHRGTDFAAPSGTPIMASGSGTVTRARWCGGGGNCVKIKHNSTYETIYAHMKAFAKGIKEGKKVKQGQIIGYVGSTGLSTGPHLHYEVLINGKKVNSQKLKLPSGKILKGEARKEFELKRIKTDLRLAELR